MAEAKAEAKALAKALTKPVATAMAKEVARAQPEAWQGQGRWYGTRCAHEYG